MKKNKVRDILDISLTDKPCFCTIRKKVNALIEAKIYGRSREINNFIYARLHRYIVEQLFVRNKWSR